MTALEQNNGSRPILARKWAARIALVMVGLLSVTGCVGYVSPAYETGSPDPYYDGAFYGAEPDIYVFGGGPYYHHYGHEFSHRGFESRRAMGGHSFSHVGGFGGAVHGSSHGTGGGHSSGGGHR